MFTNKEPYVSPISNTYNEAIAHNNTSNRIKKRGIIKTISYGYRLIRYSSAFPYLAFCMFTSIIMLIGTLIVCSTTPKQSVQICERSFKFTVKRSIGYDSRPRSLAIGDFNNDYQQDIAVADYGTNAVGIFIGYGNGTFANQKTYSTGDGSHPSSLAVGDFNNDNKLDIVVANYGTNNVAVLLGYGDGTFAIGIMFPTSPSRPLSIAVGDFNNDDKLDVVVANYATHDITVLLGYGNATFGKQTSHSMGYDSFPYSVAVGDFNGDNRLDIVVANYGVDNVCILLGNDNGTFARQNTYSTGADSRPQSITIADFNNDNRLDIALANSGNNKVAVFLGYGNGTFGILTTYPTEQCYQPMSLTVADFNQDTRLDIAIACENSSSIGVLQGNGDGSFTRLQVTFSTGPDSLPYSIIVGDFNNDTELDIAVANYGTNNIGVLLGNGVPPFASPTTYSTGMFSHPYWVTVGDFNNDNQLDIVVPDRPNGILGILLGYGNGTFAAVMTCSTGDGSDPYAIAVGDFNNDNRLDIAVTSWKTNQVGVLLGYGNGTFANIMMYSTGARSGPNSVALGDFNGDNLLDMAVANEKNRSIGILLGYGDGTFASIETYSTGPGSSPGTITVGDFNKDTRLDIAVINTGSNNLAIFLGYGNGTFATRTTYSTGQGDSPCGLAAGDFNNDTRLDFAYVKRHAENLNIFLAQDNGTFIMVGTYSTGEGSQPSSIAIGDFNNDKHLDIALANRNTDNIGVALGYGNGYFTNVTTFSTGDGSYPIYVAAGDFNKDARVDIVVANYHTGNVGVFLETNYSTFRPVKTYSTGSSTHPYSVALGDFNNDNRLDIVVANAGTNNIGILLGHSNGTFENEISYSTGDASRPHNVIVGDFNKDNHFDIIVADYDNNYVSVLRGYGNGTFGMPYSYSIGDGSRPKSLTASDFNGDDWLDVVVANTGTDNVGVLLGYDYGNFTLVRSFGTGAKPTSLAISDFNNDTRQDIVVTNQDDKNVGILLGYGDGTFAKQNTYSTGADSSPCSVAAGDFNSDNRLDIVIANCDGNTIGILLGYGNGSFTDVTTFFTGTGSGPCSVAVGDFNSDNRLDVVVANYIGNNIGILLGYGNGSFTDLTTFSTGTGSGPYSVAIGDFNSDNRLDIVVANYIHSNIGVLFGFGNGSFMNMKKFSTGINSGPRSVAVGDFNSDNRLDIVVANYKHNNIGVLFGFGNELFMNIRTFSTGTKSGPFSVAVGDFNNDNRLDIAVDNYLSSNVGVLFGYGDGRFATQRTFSMGPFNGLFSVAVGDFNNDDRLDIAATNAYNMYVGVILGYSMPFSIATMYTTGSGSAPYSVEVGDFNNDDRSDIVVANSGTNEVGVLLGFGNGIFGIITTYSTGDGSNPHCVAVADLNDDDRLDIIVANYGTNNIGVLLGYGNGSFATMTIFSTGDDSHPFWVTLGDFNNDNRLDIAVANSDSNKIGFFLGYGNGSFGKQISYLMGYASHPYAIAFGDFNKDTRMDMVVANYGKQGVDILLQMC